MFFFIVQICYKIISHLVYIYISIITLANIYNKSSDLTWHNYVAPMVPTNKEDGVRSMLFSSLFSLANNVYKYRKCRQSQF